jgi:transglutaminase-like putative cysteine protease
VNFSIRYLTEYRYEAPVTDNLNALRVHPATNGSQRCDDFHVRLDPEARMHRHLDYFGTEVLEFGVARPHDHLTIDVRARVATKRPEDPPDPPWEALEHPSYLEAAGEFLMDAGAQPPEADLLALREQIRAGSPLATVRWLCDLLPDRFAYQPGVTYVGSTVADFLEAGAGVCQDFVHLALVLLRGEGIAARYVSGYFWSAPRDGGSDSLEVQTHAWVEVLLPDTGRDGGLHWIGADPTNRGLTGEQYVKIGHGRQYADVPPIKGVYRGIGGSALEAAVTMTRLDAIASPRG